MASLPWSCASCQCSCTQSKAHDLIVLPLTVRCLPPCSQVLHPWPERASSSLGSHGGSPAARTTHTL
eukprot:scaffold97838_cov19-Tisochrysis_lutea.AAC.4